MQRTLKLALGSLSGLLLLVAVTAPTIEVASAAQEITDDHVTIIYPDLPAEQPPKVSEVRDDNLTVVYLETQDDENAEATAIESTVASESSDTNTAPELTPSTLPATGHHRELKSTIQIMPNYQATILLHCITSESGNFRAIKQITSVNFLTKESSVKKDFSGHLLIELTDPNQLHYAIDGNFYDARIFSQTILESSQRLDEKSLLTSFTTSGINTTVDSPYIFQSGVITF
ncbi:hypothetical protein [Lapidilactobacillus wuchangensis]|uniref:hypothetical protein n=1 Tax=Lapidilactobacillus wuchangensis TaxID=2486001 RepID=UPI000F7A6E2A|nr:hypothetical protein [Lapidilactobacillus wuchangensis]